MGKNQLTNAGDIRDVNLISGLGRSLGRENDNPLQYSCLENSMDRGDWWATVHGATKSWTRLNAHSLRPQLAEESMKTLIWAFHFYFQ